jgi:hypothetical protein
MYKHFETLGLSLLFTLGIACGDDTDGETMAGSSEGGGSTTSGQSSSSSGGLDTGSSGGESSGSGGETTTGEESSSDGGESSTGAPVEEVFFPEVLAIIDAECFCHTSPMPSGMLDLNAAVAYDSLVNVPAVQAPTVNYVTPGDLDNSYLYLKLTGEQATVGGGGTRMPQGGMLTDEQLLVVRNWILSGAQP